jgi:nucleoside-diphosphate-sugar epimerase
MKVLITGATGFLGRYVVAEALSRGHSVRAVVRPTSDANQFDRDVECVRVDLRSPRGLVEACRDVDAVIHCAAAKSGDFYAQFAGTVLATENLLNAMKEASVKHIVAISSLSVYDYKHQWSFSRLDESSPLESHPRDRDEYAQTKLLQEKLVREFVKENDWRCTILRPGVIFGKDNLWTARLGIQGKKTWIRTGGFAKLPLTYVENCAQAIVMALESPSAVGGTFNVIDDQLPTQRTYAAHLQKRWPSRIKMFPIPWTLMRAIAAMADLTNKLIFRNRAKLPGLLIPARLHARCKPLRFSNDLLKQTTGWRPKYPWPEALDRSLGIASKSAPTSAPETTTAVAGAGVAG